MFMKKRVLLDKKYSNICFQSIFSLPHDNLFNDIRVIFLSPYYNGGLVHLNNTEYPSENTVYKKQQHVQVITTRVLQS